MNKEIIRLDWANALETYKNNIEAISVALEWGFTCQDLFILGCFHEIGLWRKEIEYLLTDCNFHTECRMLHNGNYKEYKEEVFVF